MLSITINSQTPPVRLNLTYQQLIEKYGSIDVPVNIEALESSDYQVTVGGVSRMLIQFANYFNMSPIWVALGPGYPHVFSHAAILMGIYDLQSAEKGQNV